MPEYIWVVPYATVAFMLIAILMWLILSDLNDFCESCLKTLRIHPQNNEYVERFVLFIEELREWNTEPGRHRYIETDIPLHGRVIRSHRIGG